MPLMGNLIRQLFSHGVIFRGVFLLGILQQWVTDTLRDRSSAGPQWIQLLPHRLFRRRQEDDCSVRRRGENGRDGKPLPLRYGTEPQALLQGINQSTTKSLMG